MPKVGKIYTSNLKYLNLIQIMEFNVPTNVKQEALCPGQILQNGSADF